MTASETTGVQPYTCESNALKVERNFLINLTSASSAAQMLGENKDSYVRSYIQTQSTGLLARLCGPVEHFLCTCGPIMAAICACPLSPRDRSVPFLILAFRRMLASAVAVMRPRSALLPSLHWSELRSRLQPDSQSGQKNEGQRTTTERGNYSNAGLSIKPRGPALQNMTSHCGERQNGRPSETDLV